MQRPSAQSLPLCPGVYIYKDAAGRIIYVGKARLLRHRVLSYFRGQGQAPKTHAMLAHAHSLEYLATATEKEALLLEASLIKKHRPRYNIVLRDDKSYLLFRLARKKPFARLELVRSIRRNDGARYFGPYVSGLAARQTWKAIHTAFALRRCTDRAMQQRSRPCLYHHLGQCSAPCMGLISQQAYAAMLTRIEALLAGRSRELLGALKAEMLLASEKLEFERAAKLRDQIRALRTTLEHQAAVLPDSADLDVVGLAQAENGLALGLLFVRDGMLLGGKSFFWPGLDWDDAGEVLSAFPAQFYGQGDFVPPRLLLPWLPASSTKEEGTEADESENKNPATGQRPARRSKTSALAVQEEYLSELRGAPVRIIAAHGPDEQRLVDMACLNAREEALRRKSAQALPQSLAKALHLPSPVLRIECVDVSHSSGQATRVGLVVFEDGKPLKAAFRSYAIEGSGGDDHAALNSWLSRRLAAGPPWPDLLLVDGGRGQLGTVQRAMEEAGEAGKAGLFALAAIAKAREEGRADRRAGNISDRIFLPGRANPLPLKAGGPELLFLQHIRDTAHNFALGRHRKARSKEALAGELERVPGVGKLTARLLWQHFDSLEAMRGASPEELEKIPGIGKKRARLLIEKLKILGN